MQINESTYETFFLLYIDKELSPQERLEVEDFIALNPSYAIYMEELKATVIEQDTIPFAFKAQLKQIPTNALVEMNDMEEMDLFNEMDANWSKAYKNYIAEDLQSIQGLSNQFKASLKKNNESKGAFIQAFGFNQNRYTYAAVAALLMVFFGYQQLTKSTAINNFTVSSNTELPPISSSQKNEPLQGNTEQTTFRKNLDITATTKQQLGSKAYVNYVSETQLVTAPRIITPPQRELIAMAETTEIANTAIASEPFNTNPNLRATKEVDEAIKTEEKVAVSYEIIDTEDPDRTIYIANFEIDGNKLRGLKRKVSSLFKNNKSDRNK